MLYCVQVRSKDKTESSLICVFPSEVIAALWVARIDVVKSGERWMVRTPDMASLLPKKVARWSFPNQEEAEGFVKRIYVEEKRQWEAWIH